MSHWQVVDNHHLQREFLFADFKAALDFTNKVGAIAEEEGHHPDIFLSYGKVVVSTWSHDVEGITERDHKLASRIDEIR